jgi:hypothetical protein
MAQRVSIGPNGEFFVESSEPLTAENFEVMENLYEKILEIREKTKIVSEAMNDREDSFGG